MRRPSQGRGEARPYRRNAPETSSAFIRSAGGTNCVEQRHASEHVQRPIAANGPAPRSGESIRLLRLQCCGLNREQSVDPFDRLSFARNHIVIGSPSKSAFTPMDPGARTHPGRDALRILLIARLLSNIGANYRRTTVTRSASERYNSSLPSQTVFGGCRFPVPGIKIPISHDRQDLVVTCAAKFARGEKVPFGSRRGSKPCPDQLAAPR